MNKKIKGLILLVVLAILGAIVVMVAGPASAHDAPPQGSASCTNTTTWEVNNGHATTENTGGSAVVVTISSSAGTVTQSNGSVTGDGHTITFSVSGISLSVASIQIDSKTTWAGGGVDHHYSTISKPVSGCTGSLPIPAAPVPTAPSCTHAGVATIPSNTDLIHWSLNGNVATATAQGNNTFVGGSKTAVFTETVLPQITGVSCTERIVVPTLTVVGPTCSSAGSLVIPANTASVKWLVDGNQLNGGSGGTLGSGTYAISAHTTEGYLFVGDISHVNFSEVVGSQLQAGSDACTTTVPVPAAPVATAPSCSTGGSLVIPANTDKVKWLFNNAQVNAGAGGTVSLVGPYTLSAHTTIDYRFADGTHAKEFDGTILGSTISNQICAPADLVTHTTTTTENVPSCEEMRVTNTVTVTTTTTHYVFDSESQTWVAGTPVVTHMTTDSFLYYDGDILDCYTEVVTTEPVVTQPDCTHPNGTITISNHLDGVGYLVDGTNTGDEVYSVAPGEHVVMIGILPGFKWTDGGTSTLTRDITINAVPASCATVVVTNPPAPPVKVVPVAQVQPPLAFTGNPTGLEILVGGLLFLGGVAMLFLTRGRKSPGQQY